jgi:tRNA pseudouridine38-40 synthase
MIEKKGLSPEYLKEIIDAQDRKKAGPPAPAEGLYLMKVYYPKNLDNGCLEL